MVKSKPRTLLAMRITGVIGLITLIGMVVFAVAMFQDLGVLR